MKMNRPLWGKWIGRVALVCMSIAIVSVMGFAQANVTVIPIAFQNNAGVVDTLLIGRYPGATYCIDTITFMYAGSAFNEFELPPVPPSEVFDVRCAKHRSDSECSGSSARGEGLRNDMRSMHARLQIDTFRIQIQYGENGNPVTVRWPSGLAAVADSMRLKDVFGGVLLNVDMLATQSTVVSQPHTQIEIFIYGAPNIVGVNPVGDLIPDRYELQQNYPNPFNPSTVIPFAVAEQSRITIVVYDLLGREVATLVNGDMAPGYYTVEWDGRSHSHSLAASGVYLIRMSAGSERSSHFTAVRKVVLMK